jgi:hypothetical protein
LTATEPTTSTACTEKIGFTPILVFCSVLFLAMAVGFGWMALDPEIMTDLAAWLFFPVTIDIDAVVVFGLANSGQGTVSCIGLRLRAGATLPPGEPTGTSVWQYLNRALGQGRPPDDVRLYRQIFGWRLDQTRLTKAVQAYAHPGVQIIDRG